MLLMLEDSDWRPLEELLSDPEKAPKLVERNYAAVGPSPIRALWNRSAWSDAGPRRLAPHLDSEATPRLPYVLVEDGWHGPESEGGITFRRSRAVALGSFCPSRSLGISGSNLALDDSSTRRRSGSSSP